MDFDLEHALNVFQEGGGEGKEGWRKKKEKKKRDFQKHEGQLGTQLPLILSVTLQIFLCNII